MSKRQITSAEEEEKRKRRLARNRESARGTEIQMNSFGYDGYLREFIMLLV
jgi:hypothetical protein